MFRCIAYTDVRGVMQKKQWHAEKIYYAYADRKSLSL